MPNFINTQQLAQLKTKAMRSGVWFKKLRQIDRALFDLTMSVASIIRNTKLVKSILAIANKIENAMTTKISKAFNDIGIPLVQKLRAVALKLGNISAIRWASDFNFARFLAVMCINDPRRL